MADTKKGGSGGGNSIVWSWRAVDVRHCTCMSVQAGMYCGTIQVPDGEVVVEGSCGSHCWDLGYVDEETGSFISKGFPLCGGPDAPPLPDPIRWVEFPTLNNLNRDGVSPCQQRATSLAKKQEDIAKTEANALNIWPCGSCFGNTCYYGHGTKCYEMINRNPEADWLRPWVRWLGGCECMQENDPRLQERTPPILPEFPDGKPLWREKTANYFL